MALLAHTIAIFALCGGWLLDGANAIVSFAHQRSAQPVAQRDLAFMHIPYNFGHTVESVALLDSTTLGLNRSEVFAAIVVPDVLAQRPLLERVIEGAAKPTAEFWGSANPELVQLSQVTGCSMYFTPQKYWPEDLAERYFGNKTVFGILRDPYERLVAQFRGDFPGYGGHFSSEDRRACDVNNAVKNHMRDVIEAMNDGRDFAENCAFLPQAEYFEGRHGITLAVDNRAFPVSMNRVFRAHGYMENVISSGDIFHVEGCNDVWAGDLDEETKAMVRQVYHRDFELLCEHFSYCDDRANTCIVGVEHMCPERVLYEGLVTLAPSTAD